MAIRTGGRDTDDSDRMWQVFAGRRLGSHHSVELGDADLGSYSQASPGSNRAAFDVRALYLTLIGHVAVHAQLDLLARLGVGYGETELAFTDFTRSDTGTGTGLDPVIGIGFEFRRAHAPWALRLKWTQYQNVGEGTRARLLPGADDLELNGQSIDVFGLSIRYTFE